MAVLNEDGLVSGVLMILINGTALLLNGTLMVNMIINRHSLPPYMWLAFNLATADIIFAFLGLTIRGPGMIYSDYYTSTETGKFLCVLFFYAVYPIISVNFSTYILLVLNQFLVIRRPLVYGSQGSSEKRKRNIMRAIAGTWLIAIFYFGIYLTLVHTNVGTSDYDVKMSRCSMTSTSKGKVAHMILQTIFVIIPSFTCLGLYIGMAVILRKNKRKDRGGVTNHAFVTITILLALFYLSHWPSVLLRDIPRLLQTKVKLPIALSIATSVFYYLNGLTDPIIYGFRSKFLFRNAKKQIGFSIFKSGESGNERVGGTAETGMALSNINNSADGLTV